MKITTFATIAITIGALHAGKRPLTICVSSGIPDSTVSHAEMLAARILAQAGAPVEWHLGRSCPAVPYVIKIGFQQHTPDGQLPRALAYAMPTEGTHIVVMYDRVKRVGRDDLLPQLLAYVLVHEITHILQGTARHSATGIMKAYWSQADYSDMRISGLSFTQLDLDLLNVGLEARTRADLPPVATH
jgi:hypothetical protein